MIAKAGIVCVIVAPVTRFPSLLIISGVAVFAGCMSATIHPAKDHVPAVKTENASDQPAAYTVRATKDGRGAVVLTVVSPAGATLRPADETIIRKFLEDFPLLARMDSILLRASHSEVVQISEN